MPVASPTVVALEHVGAKRANMLGRPKVDIRLGNPSPDVSSSYIPSLIPGDRQRAVWWRGRLQFETLSILMVDKDVVWLREDEPGFSWTDGREHYFLRPKFVVGRKDGSRKVVAVNWARDVVEHRLITALAHAKDAARRAGYDDIELWTDIQTRKPGRLTNAEMFYGVAIGLFDPVLLETLRVAAHRAGGTVSIRALRLACGRPNDAFKSILRLLWNGDLVRANQDELITDNTIVTASSLDR